MLRDRLQALIEPALDAMGYELVLLEYSPGIKTGSLRLFIDAVAGIDLGDCEKVSREIAALLDVEDPIDKAYQLEVSSPGLDRPLTKTEHYQRFVGEKVRVQTLIPINGRKKFMGPLLGLEGRVVLLKQDAETVRIPLADIEKAKLVPDYEKELRKQTGHPQSPAPHSEH